MRIGRSRLILLAVLGGGLVALLAAAAWYVLGEEQRMGRLVSGYLAGQTGLPITVDRARVDGSRLTLTDVRLRPSAELPVDVHVTRLDIDGGLMPLVLPAGRAVAVTVASVSIGVESRGEGGAPDARMLDTVRATVRSWLARPGTLTVRVPSGELRVAGRSYRIDLTGDKTAAGELTLGLGLGSDPGHTATRLGVRAVEDGEHDVTLRVEATGEPAALGAPWSSLVPGTVAASLEARLLSGGDLTATGRIGFGSAPRPVTLDFSARYDGLGGRLSVPRLGVEAPPGISLQGSGALVPGEGGFRVTVDTTGKIDGSRLSARASYALSSRALDLDMSLSSVSIDRLIQRASGHRSTTGAMAGSLKARVHGVVDGAIGLDVKADRIETAAAPGFAVDASLVAEIGVTRGAGNLAVGRLRDSTLRLARAGASLATVTARSQGKALWPISVEAVAGDLGPIAAALAKDAQLAGTARFSGEVREGEGLGIVGRVRIDVPRAAGRGGAVVLSALRADVPIAWNASPAGEDGDVSLDRLTAWGFHVDAVRSSARLTNARLLLPDVRAAHHGGRTEGWAEAAVDGRAVPVRSRLEGDRIDLAALVRESGSNMARITGRIHYVLDAQYTRDSGLAATVDFESQEDGEVAIEPIQQLLLSPAVQVESSGLLRQTLETLRVFEYESLRGTVRARGNSGRADLALRGKKRLWIFPGPVEAINLKNVPLELLVRTLEKGSSP